MARRDLRQCFCILNIGSRNRIPFAQCQSFWQSWDHSVRGGPSVLSLGTVVQMDGKWGWTVTLARQSTPIPCSIPGL